MSYKESRDSASCGFSSNSEVLEPLHIVLIGTMIPATRETSRGSAPARHWKHLVRPLGFSTDDKHLKRAGLDYWPLVKVHYHDSFEEVQERYVGHNSTVDEGTALLHGSPLHDGRHARLRQGIGRHPRF